MHEESHTEMTENPETVPPDDVASADEPMEPSSAEPDAPEATGPPAPEDWHDRWLRAEADLQNFRRRAVRDREDTVRFAEDRLLLEMVGAIDDLERALGAAEAESAAAAWAQGVALTAQRLRDALSRFGVETISSVGQPFDPMRHEAMLEIDAPSGTAPGAVAQEVQRGYRRGERTLRPARVVVARIAADAG